MKKFSHLTFPVLFLYFLLAGLANAYAVSIVHFTGKPDYITFDKNDLPSLDRLTEILSTYGFQSPEGLQLINAEPDQLGMVHYRYRQTNNGYPVEKTMWLVHTFNGKIISMNGVLLAHLPGINAISTDDKTAYNAALKYIAAQSYYSAYAPGELYWASPGDTTTPQSYRLCYRYDIYAQKPLARKYVFVDVTSSSVINTEDRINESNVTGSAHTAYSGTQSITTDQFSGGYRLRETGRGNGIETYNLATGTDYGSATDFTNATTTWNNINGAQDQYATDAHWGAEVTYDFYKNKFNRNSLDNAGLKLLSYVHFYQGYLNAFWDGSKMTYGDGCCGYSPLTSLDICGHEMSHGVTEFTAGLIYQNESGALNEGFSDCMGTAIEFFGKPAQANWTMGEDIGAPFRNMANPKQYQQPNTYLGSYWYTGGSDNGGVHTNSGILNYWFYLLSVGGSGTNDLGNAYTVSGITLAKAQAILYRAQSLYMFPSAQYADARTCTIKAATDLYPQTCAPEVIAVIDAWYAVGLGTATASSSVSISVSPGTVICPGASATFTASPTNGGTAPVYQWRVNSATKGANSATFTTSTLSNNDKVECVMTSNAGCVGGAPDTSNTVTMNVGTVAAGVSFTSNPSGILCQGSPVIFTATPVNGGLSPSYQWKVNSASVGTNSPVYTAPSLNDNDSVKCIMTSSISCATGNPALFKRIETVVKCTGLNVSFKSEDTVNVNQAVNLTNTSVGYSDFIWNFCTTVPEDSPTFTNMGNFNGLLDQVDYTSLRQENGKFYSFTGRTLDGEAVGAVYGNSFNNTPTTSKWYNGVAWLAGIQCLRDTATGREIFMSVSIGNLYRVYVGNSLASPLCYNCVNRIPYDVGMTWNASDLQIVKYKGTLYGFIADHDDTGGVFIALNFGNSLLNTPTHIKYRLPNNITSTNGLCVRYNQQTNHFILFITSSSPQALVRYDLGASPGGIPVLIDSSNPFPNATGLQDVAIIQECNGTYGLALFNQNPRVLKFGFNNNNISDAYVNPHLLPLSSQAQMNNPRSFSEFYNADTTSAERVMFITDKSGQLIRMNTSRCTGEAAPTTHATNPGPVIFQAPGTYTISLTGGIGTSYEETYCRTVYVKPCFGSYYAKVSIAANPGNTFCPGTSVTFTASPINGGSVPTYVWFLNGDTVSTSWPTYTSTTLHTGDKIYCQMTSNAPCISGSPCLSDTISITLLPTHPAVVTITSNPANSVCSGRPVVFTASSANEGTLSYQWKVNSNNVGSNSSTYSNSSLNNHDTIYCQMSSNSLCVTGSPATSNKIVITVIPTVAANLTIAVTPNDTICAGTPLTFTATPVNGGTPVYQWKLNGANAGTNSATYTNSTMANDNTVSCVMTSNATCVTGSPATSNTIKMTVYPNVVGSVSIAAKPGSTFCKGTSVTFTATPVSGATPSYQWKLNSKVAGSNSNQYSNSNLNNSDTVTCTVTLTGHCITGSPATSNKIIVTVNNKAIAGNIIVGKDTVCSGAPDTLTLVGHSGSPIQWQSSIAPPAFTTTSVTDTFYKALVSQSTYYRVIVGAGKCPDTSAQIRLFVPPSVIPIFTYTVVGKQVTFSTHTENNISIHWDFGDDSTANNTENPVHTYLNKGTYLVCLTLTDGAGCVTTTCQRIDLTNTEVNTTLTGSSIKVYPSPFSDKLFIDFSNNASPVKTIQLFDVLGRKLMEVNLTNARSNNYQLNVPDVPGGIYYLSVKTNDSNNVFEVVRE